MADDMSLLLWILVAAIGVVVWLAFVTAAEMQNTLQTMQTLLRQTIHLQQNQPKSRDVSRRVSVSTCGHRIEKVNQKECNTGSRGHAALSREMDMRQNVVCIKAENVSLTEPRSETENVKGKIKRGADVFVKTAAYEVARKCLEQFKHVTIIGDPGTGKTTIGYQLLRDFRHKCSLFIIKHPEEIKERSKSERLAMYLINDVFGAACFQPNIYQKWRDWFGSNVDVDSTYFIFTSRNYVYLDALSVVGFLGGNMFEENTIIDLSVDYKLTESEKSQMVQKHRRLSHNHIGEEQVRKILALENIYSFPYSCYLYFKLENVGNPLEVFKNPLIIIIDTMNSFLKSDPKKYIAIMLVLLHEGELNLLRITVLDKHLARLTKMHPDVSKEEFIECLWEIFPPLCGSFLSVENDIITFNHATIFSAAAYLLGRKDPIFVTQHCPLEFLFERVWLKQHDLSGVRIGSGLYEDKRNLRILLTQDLHYLLAERFAKELSENKFPLVCAHNAMSDVPFLELCFHNQYLARHFSVYNVDKDFSESILYWSVWNQTCVLCQYLITKFQFDYDTMLKAVLCCCCGSGNIEALRCLLKVIPKELVLSYETQPADHIYAVSASSMSLITVKKQKSLAMESFLHKACESGHLRIVELLLAFGFEVHICNKEGDTLLHKSTMSKEACVTQLLITLGCKINQSNDIGDTPLHRAVQYAAVSHASVLLKHDSAVNIQNNQGDTPLIVASSRGHLNLLKLLISNKANVNHQNRHGSSALMVSSINGHYDVVKELLLNNANTDFVDREGNSALTLACTEGHDGVVEILLKNYKQKKSINSENSPLLVACAGSHVALVKRLLKCGLEAACVDTEGNSPLIIACRMANVKLVDLLLKHNADIHVFNKEGDTPLTLAFKSGNGYILELLFQAASLHVTAEHLSRLLDTRNIETLKMVKMLLLRISSTEMIPEEVVIMLINQIIEYAVVTEGNFHTCPLTWASIQGYTHLTRFLLANDPEVEFGNIDPLVTACIRNNNDIVDILLSYNFDVNAFSSNGTTPLVESSLVNNAEAVKRLVSHNADVNQGSMSGDTALAIACSNGFDQIVEILLKQDVNVNCKDKKGRTSLILACRGSHEHVVRIMIAHMAQEACEFVNTADDDRETALIASCKVGNNYLVDLLLLYGANVDCANIEGNTALFVAVRRGDKEIIAALFAYGADISVKNKKGSSALQVASANNHKSIVRLLLKKGADINAYDNNGMTALMFACIKSHVEIVQVLTDSLADVNISSCDGYTALMWACRSKDSNIVQMLLRNGAVINVQGKYDGFTPLICACVCNHPAIVDLLLQCDIDVTVEDSHGWGCLLWCIVTGRDLLLERILPYVNIEKELRIPLEGGDTPLMLACRAGYTNIVQILLPYARIDVKDQQGNTPLHLASQNGSFIIVELLIKYDASNYVNDRNMDGDTPLHLAAARGFQTIVDILLCCGADISQQNEMGKTASDLAVGHPLVQILLFNAVATRSGILRTSANGSTEELKMLLRNRFADVNTRNGNGETPLMLATRSDKNETVDLLLSSRAFVNRQSSNNDSALSLAVRNNSSIIVNSLIAHGANINSRNGDGNTPLILACQYGCTNVFEVLISHGADINIRNNITYNAWAVAEAQGHFDLADRVFPLTQECIHEAPLSKASRTGDEKRVKALIDLSDIDANKETALMVACREGHTRIVEVLVREKMHLNSRNIMGETALIIACKRGRNEIVKVLLKASVITNISNKHKNTALHLACKYGFHKIVKKLLKHGAWVDVENKAGETPMIMTCKHGHIKPASILLKKQAKVNTVDHCGNSPLHWACIRGSLECVQLLLSAKVNINTVNKSLVSPIMCACEGGFVEIVDHLLKANANVSMRNANGHTCVDIVKLKGHDNIYIMLKFCKPAVEEVCAQEEPIYAEIDDDAQYDDFELESIYENDGKKTECQQYDNVCARHWRR